VLAFDHCIELRPTIVPVSFFNTALGRCRVTICGLIFFCIALALLDGETSLREEGATPSAGEAR
jgi:hypothetical protein